MSRLQPNGRDFLVVSGLGPVGLLATMFATAMGTHVIGIDPSAERRRFAKELGAREALDPTASPIVDQVKEITGLGAHKLIETSGSNAAHAVIGGVLRPLGTAAIVGLGSQEFKMPLMSLVHRQITLFGTSIYPDTQIDEIWDFVRDHKLSLSRVVTDYYNLDDGQAAFDKAETATAGKVCFRFD